MPRPDVQRQGEAQPHCRGYGRNIGFSVREIMTTRTSCASRTVFQTLSGVDLSRVTSVGASAAIARICCVRASCRRGGRLRTETGKRCGAEVDLALRKRDASEEAFSVKAIC